MEGSFLSQKISPKNEIENNNKCFVYDCGEISEEKNKMISEINANGNNLFDLNLDDNNKIDSEKILYSKFATKKNEREEGEYDEDKKISEDEFHGIIY